MSAHARLSPSSAARWSKCPGSVREAAKYPNISGAAAIDGTGSHLLLELCLQNNVRAEDYDMQIIGVNHHDMPGGWMVDVERVRRVQMCLDYVTRRVGELTAQFPGTTITVEAEGKSDPGGMFGRDDWHGTADVTILVRDPHLGTCLFVEIIDYKDGRGWVDVRSNEQLTSYLGGRLRPYVGSGPDKVRPFNVLAVAGGCRNTVVQPKTKTPVRYEDLTVSIAFDALIEMATAARATDDPNAPLVADDKGGKGYCTWCPHKNNCNAQAEKGLATVESMNTEVINTGDHSLFEYIGTAVADPTTLTPAQLSELSSARPGLMAAFDKVDKEIVRRIEAGEHVPGKAMLPGNGKNVWNKEPDEIAKMLKGRRMKKDEIYPTKLISPAQVLKLDSLTKEQKDKIESEHISHVAGALTLKDVAITESVGQSGTTGVKSPASLFDEVPETNGPTEEVSFF